MNAALLVSLNIIIQTAAVNMYDVIDAVDAFVAPPECTLGCIN